MKSIANRDAIRLLYKTVREAALLSENSGELEWIKKSCQRLAKSMGQVDDLARRLNFSGTVIGKLYACGLFNWNSSDRDRFLLWLLTNAWVQGEIRLGLGGSEKEASARLPLYVLPAGQLLMAMYEAGAALSQLPTLRIIDAGKLSASVNDLDQVLVERNMEANLASIKVFIGTFFPALKNKIAFWQIGKDDIETFISSEFYGKAMDVVNRGDVDISNLARNGRTKGTDRQSAIMYGICHLLVFGKTKGPESILKIGGSGEVPFNRFQDAIMHQVYAPADIIQPINLVTVAGEAPPYYLYEGDIPLSGAKGLDFGKLLDASKDGHPAVMKDLMIADLVVGGSNYCCFLDSL